LDNIGLRNSPKNYKYWEAMQMIYHGFARREERETKNVTEINLSNFQTLKEEELQKLAGQ
jgi:predicted RNA-binding protein Jag